MDLVAAMTPADIQVQVDYINTTWVQDLYVHISFQLFRLDKFFSYYFKTEESL